MAHPYITRGALAISMVPGLLGLSSMIEPNNALRRANFQVPAEPGARKLTRGLMRIYGIRNISVSYLLYLIWAGGNEKTFGLGLLACVGMVITDGIVVRQVTGGGEWNHLPVAGVLGGLSAGLLGFFR